MALSTRGVRFRCRGDLQSQRDICRCNCQATSKIFQGLLCCPLRLEFLVSGQVNCLPCKGDMGIFRPCFALVPRSSQVFKVIDPSLFNFDVCRLLSGIKSKTPSILFSMARNITGVLRGVLFKGG